MSAIEIRLTDHAVKRFQERVRPALTVDQARDELIRLKRIARVGPHRPEWLDHMTEECDAVAFITDEIVLILSRTRDYWLAVTCIARGGQSASAREAKNHQRRGRQRARHAAREKWREKAVRRSLDKGRGVRARVAADA